MFHMMSDNLPVFLDEKSKTFDFEEEVTMNVREKNSCSPTNTFFRSKMVD